MPEKFDNSRDLLLRDKILPAQLFIKRSSSFNFFHLIKRYEESSQISNKKFERKNKLPTEIRKEETKKFKEKITREMIKLHERFPIDRQVSGFRNYFADVLRTKRFICF